MIRRYEVQRVSQKKASKWRLLLSDLCDVDKSNQRAFAVDSCNDSLASEPSAVNGLSVSNVNGDMSGIDDQVTGYRAARPRTKRRVVFRPSVEVDSHSRQSVCRQHRAVLRHADLSKRRVGDCLSFSSVYDWRLFRNYRLHWRFHWRLFWLNRLHWCFHWLLFFRLYRRFDWLLNLWCFHRLFNFRCFHWLRHFRLRWSFLWCCSFCSCFCRNFRIFNCRRIRNDTVSVDCIAIFRCILH